MLCQFLAAVILFAMLLCREAEKISTKTAFFLSLSRCCVNLYNYGELWQECVNNSNFCHLITHVLGFYNREATTDNIRNTFGKTYIYHEWVWKIENKRHLNYYVFNIYIFHSISPSCTTASITAGYHCTQPAPLIQASSLIILYYSPIGHTALICLPVFCFCSEVLRLQTVAWALRLSCFVLVFFHSYPLQLGLLK